LTPFLTSQEREANLLRQRNAEMAAHIKMYDDKIASAAAEVADARKQLQEMGMVRCFGALIGVHAGAMLHHLWRLVWHRWTNVRLRCTESGAQISSSKYDLLKSAHDRLEGEYKALQDERNRQNELLAQIRSLQENLEHAGTGEKSRLVCARRPTVGHVRELMRPQSFALLGSDKPLLFVRSSGLLYGSLFSVQVAVSWRIVQQGTRSGHWIFLTLSWPVH
jgi:hypothetical protein